VPKQVIASRLSITPETLSRILHAMAKDDIISINGKVITINSVRRLREFGHYDRAQYAMGR
jgi:CRP-like cAMP-binding protein